MAARGPAGGVSIGGHVTLNDLRRQVLGSGPAEVVT